MNEASIPNVLIVDDEADTLAMLEDVLKQEKMSPVVRLDGAAAIRSITDLRPDIVLMDAVMPGMDGFEISRVVRQELGLTDLPIIFMTGHDRGDHVVRAFEAGAVDFLSKPLILPELIARIRLHLANARRSLSTRAALDTIGRRIVAVDQSGTVLWATPQAQDLLAQVGLRTEQGQGLPWNIREWLGSPASAENRQLVYSRFDRTIELLRMTDADTAEILLRVIDRDNGSPEDRLARAFDLSPRESEVLTWIAHGKSNKEIAEILTLSPRTVNKNLERIFGKMGIENRTAAATMAVRILWQ